MEIFILLVVAFYALLILISLLQYETWHAIKELKEEKHKENNINRKHVKLEENNYNSVLKARGESNGYEVFKNKYEPVRPNQGIKIEKPKEE